MYYSTLISRISTEIPRVGVRKEKEVRCCLVIASTRAERLQCIHSNRETFPWTGDRVMA